MDGQSAHNTFVHLAPWLVIGVAAVAIALTAVALGVFLITQLLSGKTQPAHGSHDHGHSHH